MVFEGAFHLCCVNYASGNHFCNFFVQLMDGAFAHILLDAKISCEGAYRLTFSQLCLKAWDFVPPAGTTASTLRDPPSHPCSKESQGIESERLHFHMGLTLYLLGALEPETLPLSGRCLKYLAPNWQSRTLVRICHREGRLSKTFLPSVLCQ